MPFTPSHIVAVLPIAWCSRRLPFSALAIGSMIPDLPLFFPISNYWLMHDPSLVLTTCLPLGLAAFVLFHLFLKAPLESLLPRFVQERIAPYSGGRLPLSWSYWLCVVVAIVIGAYTHIFWDSFTHHGRWGTQTFPALNGLVDIGIRKLPIFKFLQHLSSIGGLVILAVMIVGLLFYNKPSDHQQPFKSQAWLKLFAASLLVLFPILSWFYLSQFNYTLLEAVGLTIRLSGALLVMALTAYALVFHVVTKAQFVEQ
jgi:hypothetical protein